MSAFNHIHDLDWNTISVPVAYVCVCLVSEDKYIGVPVYWMNEHNK